MSNSRVNLLIIREGSELETPSKSFFDEMMVDKVWVLYLSPCAKASQYKEELQRHINREVEVEIIDYKKLVDFNQTRKKLLDFIADLSGRLRIGKFNLPEYLTIQGLNMWWTSSVVEASGFKQNLFQNLYHLSAVKSALKEFSINTVWFNVGDFTLERDLISMLKSSDVKYYLERRKHQWPGFISSIRKWQSLKWLSMFISRLVYSIVFKIICPGRLKPKKSKLGGKSIHAFYSYYPHSIGFRDNTLEVKIYKDLPPALSKKLGGEEYYLIYLFPRSVFSLWRLIKESRRFWKINFRFIPMDIFVSKLEILRIFLSPVGWWKYFRLKTSSEYCKVFKVNDIDMFHTFDRLIKKSIIGFEARMNLFHYYAFRRFSSWYGKSIFQIVYHLELHSWEVALISGAKSGDVSVPVVGLQQSAPNPILLNYFFPPEIVKSKENAYPLPDLITCSGEIQKELFLSMGIEPERVEIIGHIIGQYLNQPNLSPEAKQQRRSELGFPSDKSICFIACSIVLPATEGLICLLRQVVDELPEILFLIKGHPTVPIESLLRKYGMDKTENVKITHQSVPTLLPISDYFFSTNTSVSQEALCLGLPQVNLNVGGLPQANPLCLIPGFIKDVGSSDELLHFLRNTEKFRIPKEKGALFMGNSNINPCEKFLESVVARFHG